MANDPKNFWEFSIGTVITWIGGLVVGVAAWMKVKLTQESMVKQLDNLEAFAKDAILSREKNAVTLARIEDDLENYHQRIRKLEAIAETSVRIESQTKEIYRILTNRNGDP